LGGDILSAMIGLALFVQGYPGLPPPKGNSLFVYNETRRNLHLLSPWLAF